MAFRAMKNCNDIPIFFQQWSHMCYSWKLWNHADKTYFSVCLCLSNLIIVYILHVQDSGVWLTLMDLWANTRTVTAPELLVNAVKKKNCFAKDFTGKDNFKIGMVLKYWSVREVINKLNINFIYDVFVSEFVILNSLKILKTT